MKSSTKSLSVPDPRSNKGKRFTCVGGLVFAPTKDEVSYFKSKGLKVIPGIDEWIRKGAPDHSIVLDFAGALVDSNFPIVDAVLTQGYWLRCPVLKPPTESIIYRSRITSEATICYSNEDMLTLSKSGIVTVDPEVSKAASGHGKMSRGVGSRGKKADDKGEDNAT